MKAIHVSSVSFQCKMHEDCVILSCTEVDKMVQSCQAGLSLHCLISLISALLGFAGFLDFNTAKLELLLPASGFKDCRKVATVMPEGLDSICQSIYVGVSDGKIAAYTNEAAGIAKKTTLIQMGMAAGNLR